MPTRQPYNPFQPEQPDISDSLQVPLGGGVGVPVTARPVTAGQIARGSQSPVFSPFETAKPTGTPQRLPTPVPGGKLSPWSEQYPGMPGASDGGYSLNFAGDGENPFPDEGLPGNEPPAGGVPPATVTPPASAAPTREAIAAAYQQAFGRAPQEFEYLSWLGNNNFASEIANSPEARAHAAGQQYQRPYNPVGGADTGRLNDPNNPHNNSPKYQFLRALQERGGGRGNLQGAVDYYNAQYGGHARVLSDDTIDMGIPGWGPIDLFNAEGDAGQWTPVGPGTGGSGGTGGTGGPGGGLGGFGGGDGASGFGGDMGGLLDTVLAQLLLGGGTTPYGHSIQDQLTSLIERGGLTPAMQEQIVGARETAGRAQEGLINDARGTLADQGGLSVPGIEQGATNLATERAAEQIAPEFSGALRDIYTHAIDVGNESVMSSLQLATGMSADEAHNILNAVGTGTQRQTALANIALGVLDRDMQWNMFLANFGLDQARLAEDIQNGRLDHVISLLQLFLQGAGQSAGGFIGH